MGDIYYVYLLLDPRDFYSPFYVGKGKGNRWRDHLHPSSARIGKNQLKNSIIRKIRESGQDIGMLFWQTKMSEHDALELEKSLIAKFGRRVDGTGILANLTTGGEGTVGRIYTAEEKEKCRQRMLGAGSPTYGVGHTDEARRKMSEAQKARCAAGNVTRHSEAHRRRLREDNAGGRATAKPVHQIGDNLSIIREWPSANSAAKALGLSKGNLCGAIEVGHRRKVGGFYWRLVGSTDVVDGRLVLPPKPREKHRRTLIQISEDGDVVREWDDLYEAAANIGAKYATLWAAAKYGRPCGGYRWIFRP